jgi:hypothetical protein
MVQYHWTPPGGFTEPPRCRGTVSTAQVGAGGRRHRPDASVRPTPRQASPTSNHECSRVLTSTRSTAAKLATALGEYSRTVAALTFFFTAQSTN